MAIVDLIFENPLIIISLVLSLLILLTAGVLLMISLARPMLAERRRQRILPIDPDLLDDETEDADGGDMDDTMPTLPLKVKWAKNANATEVDVPTSEAVTQLETEETPEDEEEVSEEMQDILSSVFAEESEEPRYAALLRDQEIPSAQELVILSRAVSAKLTSSTRPRGKGQS